MDHSHHYEILSDMARMAAQFGLRESMYPQVAVHALSHAWDNT